MLAQVRGRRFKEIQGQALRSHCLVSRTSQGQKSPPVFMHHTSPTRPCPSRFPSFGVFFLLFFSSIFILVCCCFSSGVFLRLFFRPQLGNLVGGDHRYCVPVLLQGQCRQPHPRHLQFPVSLGGGGKVTAGPLVTPPSHIVNTASLDSFSKHGIAEATFLTTVKPQRTRWVYEWEGEVWKAENV